MSISVSMKQWISELLPRIPEDKREQFLAAVRARLQDLRSEPVIGGAIVGGLVGSVIEVMPGLEGLTGIDDGAVTGAAVGAAYGWLTKNKQDTAHQVVLEELRRVLGQ